MRNPARNNRIRHALDEANLDSIGPLDERKRRIFDAVFAARAAALQAITPGATGAAVDRASRSIMAQYGYDGAFKHVTGHGVGFSAIDHNATPRIHPASHDVLEPGMVFNVEPAAYFEGWGGVRHCDTVAATESGSTVLSDFDCDVDALALP